MYNHAQRQHRKPKDLPKFWYPKIKSEAQTMCKLCRWDLVDRLIKGQADEEVLWDWFETGFTYKNLMNSLIADGEHILEVAESALANQIQSYIDILTRFRATGRVGLSGPQIKIARDAACAMDGLITMDRFGFAHKAALLSIEQVKFLKQVSAQKV